MDNPNLAERLKHALEDRLRLLDLVIEEATRRNLPLYIVGGSVRDLLLGYPVNDFDLTVQGDAIALGQELAHRHGGGITAHVKFGTAKWFLPDHLKKGHGMLDLISARSETYKHPAALPTVEIRTIEEDLRRRDFTINAMAIRLDGSHFGELRDELHGMEDLHRGIVRVLHGRSFIDDPTRMYRAVRYEVRYGFRIAEDTLALIPEASAFVKDLSPQRIRHELDLILDERNAVPMLKRLDELDLLTCIHPALAPFEQSYLATLESDDAVLQNRNSRWALWLMHLMDQEIESINDRLHFPAELLKLVRSMALLNANLTSLVGLKPSEAVLVLESYSFKALEVMSAALPEGEIKDTLSRYISDWWHIKPKTTGYDLKTRGIPPGPRYNEILRRLRAAWLDGEVKTEEEEKQLLNTIL